MANEQRYAYKQATNVRCHNYYNIIIIVFHVVCVCVRACTCVCVCVCVVCVSTMSVRA